MSHIDTVHIPLGNALSVTTDAFTAGVYGRLAQPGEEPYSPAPLEVSTDYVVGPFNEPRDYAFYYDGNQLAFTLAYNSVLPDANIIITAGEVEGDDLVVIQDDSDSNNFKVVTAQSIADLVIDSTVADTKQDVIDALSIPTVTVAVDDKVLIQDTSASDALKTVTTQAIADLFDASGYVEIPVSPDELGVLANDANGTAIATAVNAIKDILIAAGLAVAAE